jgi:hypothetical protein
MSELKVYHHELRHNEYEEFYLKYEADKEIQRLEKLCENYRCDCDNLAIMTDTMRKAGRTLRQKMNHQKYKRCLAMAKWCDEVMMSCELRGYAVHRIWANRHQWAMRWKYRWLSLADKFKDKEA